jgi:hypothetical protein
LFCFAKISEETQSTAQSNTTTSSNNNYPNTQYEEVEGRVVVIDVSSEKGLNLPTRSLCKVEHADDVTMNEREIPTQREERRGLTTTRATATTTTTTTTRTYTDAYGSRTTTTVTTTRGPHGTVTTTTTTTFSSSRPRTLSLQFMSLNSFFLIMTLLKHSPLTDSHSSGHSRGGYTWDWNKSKMVDDR